MPPNSNPKDPTWINTLLLAATFLTLGLALFSAYRGWKEDRALHPGGEKHSAIIADIPINLSGVPQQEHCLTCHPQGRLFPLGRTGVAGKEHPDISPHSMYELGCTGCHLGEGMARDLLLSHGRHGLEARKTLAGKDLEAGCYRCHELKPLRGAEKAWQGFQLFSQNACGTCHTVEDVGGGRYGPDLSMVGSLLGLKQIQSAIEEPRAEPENSIMPKFSLSPGQIKAISYFLKSRVKDPFYETPMTRMVKARERVRSLGREEGKAASVGKEILRKKKCLACHKYGEEDGQVAPDLTFLAYMRSEDYIRGFLENPRRLIAGAMMPWISLSAQEEERIIQTLRNRETKNPHKLDVKHLYMRFCQRCHAAQGDGLGTIQPNLANFPHAFWKNAAFFRRVSDERVVRSVEKGIPGTSMPPYGELLGREGIDSLINLIYREFIRIKRSDKERALSSPPRPKTVAPSEEAENSFRKNCARCHGMAGTGRGPEYLKFLPRPRDLTNQPYFQSLSDDRVAEAIAHGVPGTGMPAFGKKMSPEILWSLVKKVREFSNSHGNASSAN